MLLIQNKFRRNIICFCFLSNAVQFGKRMKTQRNLLALQFLLDLQILFRLFGLYPQRFNLKLKL